MLTEIEIDIREGKFQRWLTLITAGASALSGLEVSYEHYKGSYSRRVMYTPVVLSFALSGAGIAAFFTSSATKTLRAISAITLVDCAAGFCFHVRGIQRKPGGWKIPIVNIVMGPPIFAPLLFGTAAYLGFISSFLRRSESDSTLPDVYTLPWEQHVREGRFQKQMAIATAVSAFFSGFEAWYSHYKNNFRYKIQWLPIVVAPLLIAAGIGAVRNKKVARTWLPILSSVAVVTGGVGFYYHARGVVRRPGGLKKPIYNVIYGPPVFAPLLFAATGFLGILASLLRREPKQK